MSMKLICSTLLFVVFFHSVSAQSDSIFKTGFEFTPELNDTGITWAGEYPADNNVDCTSSTLLGSQDCHVGRDLTHNDDSDGHAGFSFTKLDATGTPLLDQSVDYNIEPWSCIRDNVTGLVWEVKTTTTGIHHKDNTYQWGGLTAIGRDHINSQGTYYDPSWNELVQGSNDSILCGFDNWRVPTVAEFSSIVNKGATTTPSIDTNYFPNTESSRYWSSSPDPSNSSLARLLHFINGNNSALSRSGFHRVRLVRSGQ